MNFEEFRNFLLNQMQMTFIYQPVIIKKLLEGEGEASIQDLAVETLLHDEAQKEYYVKVVNRYPRSVLKKRGIINTSKKGYLSLNVAIKDFSDDQKRELIEICNQKIQ